MLADGPRGLFGELTVYRERGHHLRRLEQFTKAKESFDLALVNAPDNVGCLTGRSHVCTEGMEPMQAYKDAVQALTLEPNNMEAKKLKAKALFAMTHFEHSVTINARELCRRKQPPYFLEGMNTGLQAIRNCIGENTHNVMLNFLPIISKQEEQKKLNRALQKTQHKCRIPQPEAKSSMTEMEVRKYARIGRVMALKYFGTMAYDKFFLQRLLEDRRLMSANIKGSIELKSLIKKALGSLTEQQEILRTQSPYYTIELAEHTYSERQQKFKQAIIESERKISTRAVEKALSKIEGCLQNNHIKELITRSERLQIFMDSKPPKILPNRDTYIDKLYRMIGEAYYSQYRLNYAKSERGNRHRIAFLMGLPAGRPSSHDSVIVNFPHKYVNLKQETEKMYKKLRLCDNLTMKCWLLYEIATLLLLQKNHQLSKYYAKRCQRQSYNSNNVIWWMNSFFILLSSDMRQGNANDVRVQVEEALIWSKKMQDSERVQAFLTKCVEMASGLGIKDERTIVKARERQILSVMNEEERDKTKLLFKQISGVPPHRQMTVVPSFLKVGDRIADRRKRLQNRITVVSGTPKALPIFPKTTTPGLQLFDKY